jgi:hypothetical protein
MMRLAFCALHAHIDAMRYRFAIPLPSLGVSSLDFGRLRAAFSFSATGFRRLFVFRNSGRKTGFHVSRTCSYSAAAR